MLFIRALIPLGNPRNASTRSNKRNIHKIIMSTSSPYEHESAVLIIDLIDELNTLLNDYSYVYGVPKLVNDTLTDVEYLSDTLNYLETLFGDENHVLHLSNPAAQVIPLFSLFHEPKSNDNQDRKIQRNQTTSQS